MTAPNPDSVRLPDLQESCDSLHYRIAEGATLGGEYDWHLGFVAGWNSAHRELAKLLGGTVTTKKLDERMRTVPCPDGHDDYVWEPQAKVMGTYRCACGHAQTCKRENAREAHRRHRRTLATSVLHAENDAARKAAQIDGSGSAS